MIDIIKNLIDFTSSTGYNSTNPDPYYLSLAVGLILILTVVTCDWLRQIYKSLVHKIQ